MSAPQYGRLYLSGGSWVLTARADIRIRFKRFFGGVRMGETGYLAVSNTKANCRDLVWFMERYDLEMDPAERELLESAAAAHDRTSQDYRDLVAGDIAPRDFEMALPPREYQRVAAEIALKTGRLLVADDVGLGKTVTAIAILSSVAARPAVVVTLTHLARQWKAEIERFAPGMDVHIAKTRKPYDLTKVAHDTRGEFDQMEFELELFPDVLVLTYSKLAGWADYLEGKIRAIVYDEVQDLRGHKTQKHDAARQLSRSADVRVGLSATPIYNYGGEVHSVMQVVDEGCLGSRDEFLRDWCGGGGGGSKPIVTNPSALGHMLIENGLMIRRTRKGVGRELPQLTRSVVQVDADEAPLDAFATEADRLARIILSDESQDKGIVLQASAEFSMRLRMATGVAKAKSVAALVRMLVESGEPVVLYGWHRDVYSIWMSELGGRTSQRDLNPVMYTGSESPAKKAAAVASFMSGRSEVLIVSLRSGAGLDGLQARARTVVFGELDFSPEIHYQAEGRVYRDGQSDPVVAYYPVIGSGSDPPIMDILGVKKAQAEGIRDPDGVTLKVEMDPDRVKHLAAAYLKGRLH